MILFHDVCLTFLAVSSVFSILLLAFAFGFHILLSNQRKFEGSHDSMLKTMIMMAGEIEYGEIFFKELPPKDFSGGLSQGLRTVSFPAVTYAMFVIFFFMVAIVALNVLVGLTVDDIRNFLENADLRKLTMRLKFILAMERLAMKKQNNSCTKRISCTKKSDADFTKIHKQGNLAASATSDLISEARIWEKVEKKIEDNRKKGETEEERKVLKDLINEQTHKLIIEISEQTAKLATQMKNQAAEIESLKNMMTRGEPSEA